MTQTQSPRNLAADRHNEWQVRAVGGLAAHVTVGGTAQIFEFRRRDHHTSFNFVFLGFGLGVGPMLGAGSANFPEPHEFLWQTTKLIGQSFYVAGAQLAGGNPEMPPNPEYANTMLQFVDLKTESEFSAIDLNRAFGRVTAASASLAMGYALCYISAFKIGQNFFTSQSTGGDEVIGGTSGVSLGANSNVGMWLQI